MDRNLRNFSHKLATNNLLLATDKCIGQHPARQQLPEHSLLALLLLSLTLATGLSSGVLLRGEQVTKRHCVILQQLANEANRMGTDYGLLEQVELLHLFGCELKELIGLFDQLLARSGDSRFSNLIGLRDHEQWRQREAPVARTSNSNLMSRMLGNRFVPQTLSSAAGQPQADAKPWNELLDVDSQVSGFVEEALPALDRRDSCTYLSVVRYKRMRQFAGNSQLLAKLYDLISSDYHKLCLDQALNRLPRGPLLIKEIVGIYTKGADQRIELDLNRPANSMDGPLFNERTIMEDTSFADSVMDGDESFDLNEAVHENGPLEEVAKLSLLYNPQTEENLALEFRRQCRLFVSEIEDRWQSMEMMNDMLATEGNGIRRFNNYVIRRLSPTRLADVCSRLSLM